MDHHAALGLFREIAQTLQHAKYDPVQHTHSWTWRPGTLISPELLCPYCKTPVKTTKWVWRIQGDRLLGQFKVEIGKRIHLERPQHPHAFYDGGLCKGEAEDYIHGFLSLNPYDAPGMETRDWLWVYCHHRCSQQDEEEEEE